jgi:hypothetical protein
VAGPVDELGASIGEGGSCMGDVRRLIPGLADLVSSIDVALLMVVPGTQEATLELRRASYRERLRITSDFMEMRRGES